VTGTDPGAASIRVDLREGFEDDEVVIHVGEREVYRKDGVTTLTQIGRADAIDAPVVEGPLTVRVELPKRGLTKSFSLPASGLHLGISIEDGEMTHEVSPTPFRYA
jgi:hypothetical protein